MSYLIRYEDNFPTFHSPRVTSRDTLMMEKSPGDVIGSVWPGSILLKRWKEHPPSALIPGVPLIHTSLPFESYPLYTTSRNENVNGVSLRRDAFKFDRL